MHKANRNNSFESIQSNIGWGLFKSRSRGRNRFDFYGDYSVVKRKRRRIVKELIEMKSNKIVWEQPNTDEELYLGMVGAKVFFTIERKGYLFYCSSTPQAFMGLYDEWNRDLSKLQKKAQVALKNKGVVNHLLN